MSHVKNPSIALQINQIQELNLDEKINAYQKIINKNKAEVEQLNNQTSITDYLNDNNNDSENGTKGSRLTLSPFTHDSSFIQNDFYKDCSQETKNSTDSLFRVENNDHARHKQPIMGKTALLKKSNLEHSDSFIVHSIILNKYEDILNHYVNRMYKRRLSRRSNSEDEYSENCTIPRYSPSSISSIDTPGSIAESQANYFGNEKQFYSVEELNNDCPKESFNDSSMTCYSYFNNGTSTSCSEFDPKIFLAHAIGDLTSLGSGGQNRTSETTRTCEESVGTSHISSLLSKSNSFSSSLKRKLKRKNSIKSTNESSTKNSVLTADELLEQHKKELSRQNSIIFQISKALNFCKTSKDFFIGRERLEAEKILLVATITKEALITEIDTIEFDTYRSIYDPRCTGNIEISDLTFKLQDAPHPDRRDDDEEHFLMVLTCGKNVLSSEIMKEDNGTIKSEKTFKFRNLSTDFEISLFVYSLVMSKKDYNSQDQVKKCPSPKSIFTCNTQSRQCKISYKFKASEQIAFIPIGRCHIRNSEISVKKNGKLSLKLEQDPRRSSLKQEFDMRVKTNFELTNRLPGFLTIGIDYDKNCLTWSRRWCILDGFLLKYWNYPSEESSEPLGQIDIRLTPPEKIALADRTACARPRTLALSVSDANGGQKKYFLSADTQSDLQMWESELNFVVQSLTIWLGTKRC